MGQQFGGKAVVRLAAAACLGIAAGIAPSGAAANDPGDQCAVPREPGRFQDGTGVATITVEHVGPGCLRRYRLVSSLAPERVFSEAADRPRLRTGSVLLDGLYAMAHDDARLNAADEIRDGSYAAGNPVSCPGGCYITGKNWTYVWTRDAAYSAALGLTAADPLRMRNTLAFKLSDRRDGSGDTQVIQDTGTGGSYPVSTDRVSWAYGAAEVLDWLPDAERHAFGARAYDAIRNTVEHDRRVVFDAADGLYTGEHSFLDWREQSYAEWTKDDVANIATSRSLSTNVVHWTALDLAARLAAETGDQPGAQRYRQWADDLRGAIRAKFWLPEAGQFSQMLPNELDTAPVSRYDALGTALAVVTGVATREQADRAVRTYPQTRFGPPVLWPQQQGIGSYHNNGIWPFVTAYLLRAAAATGNDGVAELQIRSLLRGAALFATNKENLNASTGGTDTLINSDRQLWSVAATLSMVQQTLLGIDARPDGLHVRPFLPAQVREAHFPASGTAVLHGLRYRGRTLDVALELPPAAGRRGAYAVTGLRLDGRDLQPGTAITAGMLSASGSRLVVTLGDPAAGSAVPAPALKATTSKEALYGPRTPDVRHVAPTPYGDRLALRVHLGSEDPSRVRMDVLRDGAVIARDLAVTAADTTWVDPTSTDHRRISYCYSVRLRYASSGNTSQHARPLCHWGTGYDRVHKVHGDAFQATGGTWTSSANGVYYRDWGTAAGDRLVARITPAVTGDYLLQVDAAVGNDIRSGVAAGIKRLRVYDDRTNGLVAEDVVVMPNTGDWSHVRHSTFVDAKLTGGTTYRLELGQARHAVNMSHFSHNASYNDTQHGPWNFSDVFVMKALLTRATP